MDKWSVILIIWVNRIWANIFVPGNTDCIPTSLSFLNKIRPAFDWQAGLTFRNLLLAKNCQRMPANEPTTGSTQIILIGTLLIRQRDLPGFQYCHIPFRDAAFEGNYVSIFPHIGRDRLTRKDGR